MVKETHTTDVVADDISKKRLNLRDWIVVFLSLVTMASTLGMYKVDIYRLEQLEKDRNTIMEHLHTIDVMLQQVPPLTVAVTTQSDLLRVHTEALTELRMFKMTQDAMTSDFRSHMRDPTIHLTSEKQQVMVMQALAPLTDQMTKLSVQMEDRQKQWDRIEKALQSPSKTDK